MPPSAFGNECEFALSGELDLSGLVAPALARHGSIPARHALIVLVVGSATQNNIWQEIDGLLPGNPPGAAAGGVRSSPAWFNGNIYYGDAGGTLKAFAVTNAKHSTAPTSQRAVAFAYPGASPVVSANGTTDAIVWAHENISPGVLHAFDAANLTHELYNSNQATGSRDQFGPGNKLIAPTVAGGKVFVGTTHTLAIFGLLH